MIELVCLDMAGTSVQDGGAVLAAFDAALTASGRGPDTAEYAVARQYAIDTMGQSKIEVFRAIFDGDSARAAAANVAFEQAYSAAIDSAGVAPIEGAAAAMDKFRSAGLSVVLTTGFSPSTRDRIIDALGWRDLVSLALSPADAGRGRPYPDMLLAALLRTEATSVQSLAVAGDTTSDLIAGHRAGAGIVAGVRTGTHGDADFAAAPHTHVLDSVADLVTVVEATNSGDAR